MNPVQKYFHQYLNIFRIARDGFGAYRRQILILALLGFAGGLFEGIGINALIPLLSFILDAGPSELDFISRAIQSLFLFLHIPFTFRYLLVFIVLLFVFKAIALFAMTYVNVKITAGYEMTVRQRLFAKTLNVRWPYLIEQKLGTLETILMTNVRSSAEALERIGQMVAFFSSLVIYVLVAINISPQITLLTLTFGAMLILVLRPIFRGGREASHHILSNTKSVAHYVNENVIGIKTVKTAHVEADVAREGSKLFENLRILRIRSTLLRSFHHVLNQPIGLIFISVIFAFSFKTEGFIFSAFLAVVYLVQRMFVQFHVLQTHLHKINESVPFVKNIIEYERELDAETEKMDVGKPVAFKDVFAFNNVHFAYGNNASVLRGLSFKIQKGEMVGLIGPSGSGKTTVVDLALGLFSPSKGSIAVDGKNIARISLSSWRKSVGYVSQDLFLVNDTIENNIRFYDNAISMEAVKEAARQAHLLSFIESTEHGFQTEIGDRGLMLSAGQRQRLVIARILARKPQFLILDEATSALDNESELQIQEVIEELRGNVTTLVVAHRLSTVLGADRVIALDSGRVVEEGNPKELLKDSNSYFYKMYNLHEKA